MYLSGKSCLITSPLFIAIYNITSNVSHGLNNIYVCMYVCVYAYVYIYMCVCVFMCVCVCPVCVCVCVCCLVLNVQ